MSDFTAIGQLVTEARNLLDSIKGGAIRKMETAFDVLKSSIANEWNGIKTKMNNEAIAAIGRVDTATVIAAMGFEGLNYNFDYIDVVSVNAPDGSINTWPIGLAWSSSVDMNRYFKAECIPVQNAVDPATRSEVVKSLLDVMGIGRGSRYFSQSFNILKLTVKELPDTPVGSGGYIHVTSDYRVNNRAGISLMKFRNSPKTSGWVCDKSKVAMKNSGRGYMHWDIFPFNEVSVVGDEIYIALPTVCTGLYPDSMPLTFLPNQRNMQVRGDKAIRKLAGL
ncbi:Phage tail protein [Vibrio crassostreae]|nr:Phage tail protein [Vibrio crassostreae]CAK1797638.1 Phage tail protein [Vibrio crassostreae]CAK2660707.1 Phage tail protein [Vibrio crassostreae]CAK3160132.1 Phage tail protein [Vibrio crassostreae]CAK3802324.1 Phage tail protein [Vibrio crassostreae]